VLWSIAVLEKFPNRILHNNRGTSPSPGGFKLGYSRRKAARYGDSGRPLIGPRIRWF